MKYKLLSVFLILAVLCICVSSAAESVPEEPEELTFNLSDRHAKDGKEKTLEKIWEDRDDIVIGETSFYADDGDLRFTADAEGNKEIYINYAKIAEAFRFEEQEQGGNTSASFVNFEDIIRAYGIFQKVDCFFF